MNIYKTIPTHCKCKENKFKEFIEFVLNRIYNVLIGR